MYKKVFGYKTFDIIKNMNLYGYINVSLQLTNE